MYRCEHCGQTTSNTSAGPSVSRRMSNRNPMVLGTRAMTIELAPPNGCAQERTGNTERDDQSLQLSQIAAFSVTMPADALNVLLQ